MKEKEETSQLDANSPNQVVGKDEVNTSNNKLVRASNSNCGINSINFFDEKQLVAAENFLTKIMRSEKGGIKTVNDGLAVLMRAQDLNLPFSTCIEHIHVINGKTGVDIHIIKALLSRAGCTWRITKDYQPLYEYTDGFNVYTDGLFPDYVVRCTNQKEAEEKSKQEQDKVFVYPVKWYKDFKGNVYKDYQLTTNKFGIATNRQQVAEIANSGKIPVYRIPAQPVDYVTEYEITRVNNGVVTTAKGRFTFNEATNAGLFDKDTYAKYPRVLIGHRAFTYAAREIASDVLFGVMESTELKIVCDKEISDSDIQEIEAIEI